MAGKVEEHRGAVTMKQIAERAGVSIQTVSRVLNDKAQGHREETRKAVMRVASQLGYRPHALARNMARGKFGAVGLLLSTHSGRSYMPDVLLGAICDALSDLDLNLIVGRLPDEKIRSEQVLPKLLREWACDALLINYTDHIPPEMFALIRRYRMPSIWVNAKLEADCVFPDDFAAGRLAAEHLMGLGHRRIVYLDFVAAGEDAAETHYSVQDRPAGYEAAVREAGLAPQVLRPLTRGADGRRKFLRSLLMGADRPTAFVTYSGRGYTPLLADCLEMGLATPRDLSVVTFEVSPASFAGVSITTMLAAQNDLGEMAVQAVMDKLDTPADPLPPISVPFHLRQGVSTGPPPDVT